MINNIRLWVTVGGSLLTIIACSDPTRNPSEQTATVVKASQPQEAPVSTDANAFWERLKVDAVEVGDYPTIEAMRVASDVVIRGHVVGFGLSRQVQVDDGVVTFGAADVAVDEVLSGSLTQKSISMEFLLPVPVGEVPGLLAAQALTMPAGEQILFLRYQGATLGRYYLLTFGSLWTDKDGKLTAPLDPSREKLAVGLQSVADLAAQVRRSSGK